MLFASVFFFLFYSIAATKMPMYLVPLIPFGSIVIGFCITKSAEQISPRWRHLFLYISTLLIVVLQLHPQLIYDHHRKDAPGREALLGRTKLYKDLAKVLPQNATLINLPDFENVVFMFYRNDVKSYNWSPSPQEFDVIKSEQKTVFAIKDHGPYKLPDFVKNYTKTQVLDVDLN